jgi:hypothetical protein
MENANSLSISILQNVFKQSKEGSIWDLVLNFKNIHEILILKVGIYLECWDTFLCILLHFVEVYSNIKITIGVFVFFISCVFKFHMDSNLQI